MSISEENCFSSVTVLTHGFGLFPLLGGVPVCLYELADKIIEIDSQKRTKNGLILLWSRKLKKWIPVDSEGNTRLDLTDGLYPNNEDYAFYMSTLINNICGNYLNSSLVLLVQWSWPRETLPNPGFAEATGSEFDAHLVGLDQSLGGEIGLHDEKGKVTRLYNKKGDLIRTQGALFNSPLHFIGFGRGAVANSEILRRLGSKYPEAGGITKASRDLQMTTIVIDDIYDQPHFKKEPRVEVWQNVTFADNYYLEDSGTMAQGHYLKNADVNFSFDTEVTPIANDSVYGIHTQAFEWYSKTVEKLTSREFERGWFYSKLAGQKRTQSDSERAEIYYDDAVIFNGSFNVGIVDDPDAPLPGWSTKNEAGEEVPLTMKNLVSTSSIETLDTPAQIDKENTIISDENRQDS